MEPEILRDNLNETSSRYDYLVAAPSPNVKQFSLIMWSVTAGIVSISCNLLILSIIRSKRVRGRTFNIYILFITIPDSIFSSLCMMTCISNIINGGSYESHTMCQFQAWYCVFGWSANMWMNVAIAHKLLSLLNAIKMGRRFIKPPTREVYSTVLLVYLYAAFLSSWTLVGFIPIKARPIVGLACLPGEYDHTSSFFFWIVYIPLLFVLPLIYILLVIVHIFRNDLLPSHGNGRYLAVFFTRLLVVFVVMWLPSIILIYGYSSKNYWAAIIGGAWSHLQGVVSAILCLRKPDIGESFCHFLTCTKAKSGVFDDENSGNTQSWISSASEITRRISIARRTTFSNTSLAPINELEDSTVCDDKSQCPENGDDYDNGDITELEPGFDQEAYTLEQDRSISPSAEDVSSDNMSHSAVKSLESDSSIQEGLSEKKIASENTG